MSSIIATFFVFFCFVFASGMTVTLQRAEYSWAASYSFLGKINKLFPAELEPTIFASKADVITTTLRKPVTNER